MPAFTRPRLPLLALTVLLASSAPAFAQCQQWGSGFGLPGPDAPVHALGMFDDGAGASLVVGGDFTTVEGAPASHIAKWNGAAWTTLGAGLNGTPIAMRVFDDGAGPALFVGGAFTSAGGVSTGGIARWDGTTWSRLGPGIEGSVAALEIYDDGHGPALYAGGSFTVRAGVASAKNPDLRNVARWDGTSWSPLGKGTDGGVEALQVFNDGSGAKLYVGGSMQNAGGTGAQGLARWDGKVWSSIGGITGRSGYVLALAKHDAGTGAALYAGGGFGEMGGVPAANIARWNGATWAPVGSGVGGGVEDLAVFDDGSGAALHASVQNQVTRWDGVSWTALPPWPPHPGFVPWIPCMSTLHDGTSTSMYVGLQWVSMGGSGLHLLRWDGTDWRLVGREDGIPGGPECFAVLDQGAGPRLVAGGSFRHAGGSIVRNLAILEGGNWSSLGGGTDGAVHAMAPMTSGGNPGLVVGGSFTEAGGMSANRIALWQGSAWQALAQGVNADVTAVAVSQSPGPILYVGGSFEMAGGKSAHHVARWDGANWTALGSGVDGEISEMALFDSGTGPDLYVAGAITAAGGVAVNNIARWNGTAWSSPGTGVNGPVTAMAIANVGSGNALYLAGSFTQAGGVQAFRVARWNGSSWSSVGEFNSGLINPPGAMVAFDDGSGPALFAMGQSPRGDPARLWKWDGQDWSVPSSLEATGIRTLAVFDDASDGVPDLYAGGLIFQALAGGRPAAAGIARWIACPHVTLSFCSGGELPFPCPCGNTGAKGRGCDNSAATGGAELEASGSASLRADNLHLTSSGEPAGAFSIFFQGDSRIDAGRRTFGDGNRCAGGRLMRLYTKAGRRDAVTAPEASELGFAERSQGLGDPLTVGSVRYYQVLYRDADPAFCPPPLGSLWNMSNALRIGWLP